MKLQITEIQASSILTPQKVGAISGGYDFSLNPYAGCAFACSYCYVPKFPNKRHEGNEWGKWIEVKINAPELIRKDRHKVFGSRIFFSSATDPYQYIELKYRLTRKCLQELLLYQPAKLTMHTRSHLILQDLELMKKFGHRLQVGVSFPTDNDSIRKEFEPNAPSINKRLQLIETLSQAGIKVYASISPLLPCSIENLIFLLKPYVSTAWVDQMNWVEVNRSPELLKKYDYFFENNTYQQNIAALERALKPV